MTTSIDSQRQFVNRLIRQRDQRKDDARRILDNASATGRAQLQDHEQRLFDHAKADVTVLNHRINEERAELDRMGYGNTDLERVKGGTTRRGNAIAPLHFDQVQLQEVHRALTSGESRRIEVRGFNSADSLLPSQLFETVIGPQHEGRLLDHLPSYALTAPSLEYVRHTGTSGTPAIVAEGASKPELVFTVDHVVATAQKLAAHAGVSWEIISDWSTFDSYVRGELMRQVVDKENDLLLNSSRGIVGLLQTPGILTHTVGGTGTTPNGETVLDAIESGIAQLRTGTSLATANLLVLHPATWSAVRRSKDNQDRYLVAPDPTADEATSVWGVTVLQTTEIAAGTGCLLDTTKFGRALIREPLIMRTGFANDDFVKNIVRTICEERLTLAVERPTAVLAISNLPTS